MTNRHAYLSDCGDYVAIPVTTAESHCYDVLRLSDGIMFLDGRLYPAAGYNQNDNARDYIVTAWSNKSRRGSRGKLHYAFQVRVLNKNTDEYWDVAFSRPVRIAPFAKAKKGPR